MRIEGNKAVFSTGKVKYTNNGIIGLSPDMRVTEGYDGGFYDPEDAGWDDDILTKDERIELAEFMIEAWVKFKNEA